MRASSSCWRAQSACTHACASCRFAHSRCMRAPTSCWFAYRRARMRLPRAGVRVDVHACMCLARAGIFDVHECICFMLVWTSTCLFASVTCWLAERCAGLRLNVHACRRHLEACRCDIQALRPACRLAVFSCRRVTQCRFCYPRVIFGMTLNVYSAIGSEALRIVYRPERKATGHHLKAEAQTGIYHAAFQQCPCIDRPFSVEVLLWPQQRIVTGLADIQQIFGIHENAGWTESPLDEHAKYPVRHALGTIRIVFQALPARIKEFKTDAAFCFPLPSAHDAGGVLRCQRNGPPPAIVPIDFG